MREFATRLLRDEAAATSVEYAVMLALILGVIFGSIAIVGQDTRQVWQQNNNSMQSVGMGS
jgi:Flp pilus assembly pilin Flp